MCYYCFSLNLSSVKVVLKDPYKLRFLKLMTYNGRYGIKSIIYMLTNVYFIVVNFDLRTNHLLIVCQGQRYGQSQAQHL